MVSRLSAASTGSAGWLREPVQLFEWTSQGKQRLDVSAPAALSDVARMTYENGMRVQTWLHERFGRAGWDGRGTPLTMVIHASDGSGRPVNNAWFDTRRGALYFGDGDGQLFKPLGKALDVVAHEAFHGMLFTHGLRNFSGESGALHESFSDVLAVALDDRNWQIGEDVFTPGVPGDALRDLTRPRFSHVSQVPQAFTGVHDLSGIPSYAAVRVGKQLGREAMADIWYTAATKYLGPGDGFRGAANATIRAASSLYGEDSEAVRAVKDGWRHVGVLGDRP